MINKKNFLVLSAALILVACGETGDIENAVKSHLKDPSSVQFKDMVVSDSGKFACVIWNARNSMGGYGNWDVAELRKTDSGWTVTKMEGSADNCSASSFEAKDSSAQFWSDIKDVNSSNQPR